MADMKHVEAGNTSAADNASRMRAHLRIAGLLVVIWGVLAWLIAERHFNARATLLVTHETQRAEQQADIVAHNIDRDLEYLRGIPSLLASENSVRKALLRFGPDVPASSLPDEQRKERWTEDATLDALSQFLALTVKNLGTDMIWVMNAAGDCVASSNARKPDSLVGTNYADRAYFVPTRQGRPGRQYAVGRKTGVPGLFFSFPVIVDGRFIGAVAVKRDLANLSFWVDQADAFVADESGIIILARDQRLAMRALPGARVSTLPEAEMLARYKRKAFTPLLLQSWGDPRHPSLQRLENERVPLLIASRNDAYAAIDIFALRRLPDILVFEQERRWLFLLLVVAGAMLIATVSGGVFYLRTSEDARRVLAEHKKRLDEAQRIARVGSWELDLVSGALLWSDEIYRIFEIDPARFGASYASFLRLVHPEEQDMVDRAYNASVKNRQPYEITHRLLFPDGRIKHVQEHCETFYDAQGRPLRSAGTVQDVTEQVTAEAQALEAAQEIEDLYERAPCGYHSLNQDGLFTRINHTELQWLGYTRDEVVGKLHFTDLVTPASRQTFLDNFPRFKQSGEVHDLEFEMVRKDGTALTALLNATAIYDGAHRYVSSRSTVFDITERKGIERALRESEEQIRQLAYYDTLTGLPNRRLLMDRLSHALAQAGRHQLALAVMFMDLDHFKQINDTWGHDTGDELLRVVATRLAACVRSGDTVSRQGGDEFVIVLSEIAHPQDAALVADNILKSLSEPIAAHEQMLRITTSIGIAIYPSNGTDDALELMKKADTAMYAAKKAGRNGYRFYAAAP
ncbi:MAG: diguanylate cyclase [Sulfuricella sp.]